MGLRELKKTRTRQAVLHAAMQLFAVQGYAATTVEQIAATAEISTATFYRYYGGKEDIIFGDDNHTLVEQAITARPAREPLAETIGALFQRLAAEFEADQDAVIVRMRLLNETPDLQACRWATRQRTASQLAHLIAPRAGLHPDDPKLRLAIAVTLAAESETLAHWARSGGATPLRRLLADALTTIRPVLDIRPDTTPHRSR